MSRKTKIAIAHTLVISICLVGVYFAFFYSADYPDTLPPGQVPSLILPFYDFSNVTKIGEYGWGRVDYFHPGFDFRVNETTSIVAPCNAYVSFIQRNWHQEGGDYQTNVNLWLNKQWELCLVFESGVKNATAGALQSDAVPVILGQYIAQNQSVGNLLVHGPLSQVHFGIWSYGEWVCPHDYFTPLARDIFDTQFALKGLNKS